MGNTKTKSTKVEKVTEEFHKILNHKASAEEKELFFERLSEEKREDYLLLKNICFLDETSKSSRKSEEKKELFDQFWEQTHPRKSILPNLWVGLRYAAVFVFAFVSAYYLVQLQEEVPQQVCKGVVQEFIAEKGSNARIVLADGSQICLNSNARLQVIENRPDKIVTALEGEAFFEIQHNEKREFIVDLGKFKVKDLGTSFNICSNSLSGDIVTTLVEGKIEVTDPKDRHVVAMSPGDCLKYLSKTNRFHIGKADTTAILAWRNGKFAFLGESLENICSELQSWYDVEIQIQNQALLSGRYSCVIKRSESIHTVMEMLRKSSDISYHLVKKKEGKDIIIIQ